MDSAVEGVAFDGDTARFGDELIELRDRQALGGLGTGVVVDDLVDHGPVEIVGSEPESDLRDLLTQHDPVRFDVVEVVEHDPRESDHPQIHRAGRLDDVIEAGVLGMERQRDEGLETAGLVLQVSQLAQMVDAVMSLFDVPVKPPVESAGRRLQFPEDFTGDPLASNREIYVPLNNMWVNLIQPVGGKSPWRDLLERRQGGHYLNFFVDDVNASDAYLTTKGGRRILGNKSVSYSYNDMDKTLGGLTVLLLQAPRPQ